VIGFFTLIKTRPYLQDVARQANTSRVQRYRIEDASSIYG
jgi:hypothetical protein